MYTFKTKKIIILPLLLFIASCSDITSSESSLFSSEDTSLTESSHSETTEESSTLVSEITESTEEVSEVSEEESNNGTTTSVNNSEEEVTSSEEVVPSEEESSEPISSSIPEPEPEPEPGIYLARKRIGVAVSKTITIEHVVYPHDLGEVTWELIRHDPYDVPDYPAIVTPDGQVTGMQYTSDEYQIKGTLLEFEVYVTLTVFLDYDKHVDTFYPSYTLSDAIGRGNRYHNGTTMYAGISPLRNTHYYAYDLKAGMTFNVMGLTRYNADRPKFYYEFGRAVNNEFVALEGPFISDDGKAMLLGYDITEDGEYIVRVKPHIEINTSSDGFSYIKYTFWF
ncbi:MAG TPA: hypothetical protein VFD05_01490 [Bacilli bacterium]|nr:hypothetical protein [Bacilli bacterium]